MVESLEWSIIEIVLLFWNKRGRFDVFGGFDYESRGMREGRKRNQTKMPNLSNWQLVVSSQCGSESRCRRYQCHGLGRKGS